MTPSPPIAPRRAPKKKRTKRTGPGWIQRQTEALNPFRYLAQLNKRQINLTLVSLSLLLGLILTYFFTLSPKGFFAQMELKERIQEARLANAALAEQIAKSEVEVERLKWDLDYIEMIARNELGLARPGESIYKYQEDESQEN